MNSSGATIIDVHLFLPVSPTNRNDMEWVHCLHIPAQHLTSLSLRPFKLLRYMCFSIVAARGHLSLSKEHPDSVPYDSLSIDIPPNGTLDIYYHLEVDQEPYVFPINPTTTFSSRTSSAASSSDSQLCNFRAGVATRDHTCVIWHDFDPNASLSSCDVAHLVGCTKGDEYITKLTEMRSVNHPDPQRISNINDVRNGLLLNLIAIVEFKRYVAFLPIPNIYMDLTDINPPPTEKSYIVHDFKHPSYAFRSFCIRPFQPLHIASHDWPPDVLFDAVYASALCKSWGSESFRDYMTPAWNDDFYGRLSLVQGEETKHYPPRDRVAFLMRRAACTERRKSRDTMARWGITSAEIDSICDRAVRRKVQEWLDKLV